MAAAVYIDPGNSATNVAAEVGYGYSLASVIVAVNLMAMLVQYLFAKVGVATELDMPELCRKHVPRPVAYGLGGAGGAYRHGDRGPRAVMRRAGKRCGSTRGPSILLGLKASPVSASDVAARLGVAPPSVSAMLRFGVDRVSDEDSAALQYLVGLEIWPGVGLRVLEREPFGGPLWVETGGQRRAMGTSLTHLVHGLVQP